MDIEKLMLPIAEFTEYGEVCFAHLSENGERKKAVLSAWKSFEFGR